MIHQETYVRIHDLHRQGWTCKEIAAETGLHPSTVSKHLKADGPPTKRQVPDSGLVMNARWKRRTAELITAYPRLLGISVFNKIRAEGFPGAYPTVTRELRTIRGPRFQAAEAASMPIHTDPGEEAQFDFCDLSDWARRWGWSSPLWCFGMILCWSRWRIWWFTTSEDREHTFEGIARFFDAAGGIPAANRTDRMGALAGRRAAGSCCIRRRSGLLPITPPRSRPAKRGTRSARARSSGRSVSCKRRSCPRSSSTGSRMI